MNAKNLVRRGLVSGFALLAPLGCAGYGVSPGHSSAGSPPNFSGTWRFDPHRGENVAALRDIGITVRLTQTRKALRIDETIVADAQVTRRTAAYDLRGHPRSNDASVGGASETVARWQGRELVVVWTAIAGDGTRGARRVETRGLMDDGRTMYVRSVRDNAGAVPVVLVFERLEATAVRAR